MADPTVTGLTTGSVTDVLSSGNFLWKGYINAEARYAHRFSGRASLEKSSANCLRSAVDEGVCAASRSSSHVHPSRCAADFLGIPEKASVIAFKGIHFLWGLILGT